MNLPHLFQRFYLLLLGCLLLYLVLGMSLRHGLPGIGLYTGTALLIALAMLISIGAYPLARRISAQLGRLGEAVKAFGDGDLARRAIAEGNDEVASLARGFNAAAARIEQLIGAHRQLLANASHELRTPLARIRLGVELLAAQDDPKRRDALIGDLRELDDLLEEILLSSRLESTLPLQCEPEVDVLGIVAEEVARYADLDIELIGEPIPLLAADPRLLRRLVRNLLENARRHGAAPIRVIVAASGACVQVDVEDAGKGVAEEDRGRVFEPFYRSRTHLENVGSGLGLALVRQIAERHGGQASCGDSALGGARFRVELPMRVGASQ